MRISLLASALLITCIISSAISLATSQIFSIYDVQLGAPADRVLSSLSNRYTLKKLSDERNLQVWSVTEKSGSDGEWYDLAFSHGKVASIITHLADYKSEDASKLVNRLFNELYSRGIPAKKDDTPAQLMGTRYFEAQIKLQRFPVQDKDQESIYIDLGNHESLALQLTKGIDQPSAVGLVRTKSR
ncbi:MAG TPA: hypothetical protein VFY05_11570 [Candidatus Angelobacter sp.]|nr:hypothetical protein [Candidatus Angelobacter sp.]